jgi:hypothetical protein
MQRLKGKSLSLPVPMRTPEEHAHQMDAWAQSMRKYGVPEDFIKRYLNGPPRSRWRRLLRRARR